LRVGSGGCLLNAEHVAMNEPKEKSQGCGKPGEGSIYVVDDQSMLLELASVILEPLGYPVETFSSPEAALRAFEVAEAKPALIVVDYAMDRMTGLELAEACRRLRSTQKVLLVSGTVGTEILSHARVKPDGFLSKPYQVKDLLEAVKSVLAG
jgi:CheY-like chemotaxis protein